MERFIAENWSKPCSAEQDSAASNSAAEIGRLLFYLLTDCHLVKDVSNNATKSTVFDGCILLCFLTVAANFFIRELRYL